MYGSVLARTRAPCRTCCGGMPCVMSMISTSGQIRFITPWQVPTKSSCRPKSDRKVMNAGTPGRLTGGLLHGLHETAQVVRDGFGNDTDARSLGCARGFGANRDGRRRVREGAVGVGGGGRGEDDEIGLGKGRRE